MANDEVWVDKSKSDDLKQRMPLCPLSGILEPNTRSGMVPRCCRDTTAAPTTK